MWLRVGRLPWLLGLAVVACRVGYEELPLDSSGAALPGVAGSGASTATAGTGASDQAGAALDQATSGSPSLGGEAASGGEAAGIGGSAPQGGSGSPQGGGGATSSGGTTGGNAGQSTGGSAGSSCAGAVMLAANAAPTTAPPVSCAYPGALVCDDFEGGQKPYWTVTVNAPAQASLETCLVHGGSNALLAAPSATNNVQVQEQLSPTIGLGSLFMRTFAYLPSSSSLPAWTVLDEVWDSPTSWTNKISLDLQADTTITLNNWAMAGQQKTSLGAPAALLPRDRWTCIELEIVVDKTNGATRLYLDDVQVITSVGNIRTRGTKAFSTVSLGAAIAGGSPQVYYDDFVVATQRIGCN